MSSDVRAGRGLTCASIAIVFLLPWLAAAQAELAPPTAVDDLIAQAVTAFKKGERTNAIALVGKAIAADPTNAAGYALRGAVYEKDRQHEKAIAEFDVALKHDPTSAAYLEHRGEAYFRLGQFKRAIADFDRVIELSPRFEPHHWQRGIAFYYAGEYDKGRRQFELHQTVNSSDVENAVWHFLCVARASGPEKARAALIPIEGDPRVPMKQVHELFAGKAKPEDVLTAAAAGNPGATQLNDRLFYAHLYLGLYFEALGDAKKAREHMVKAAREFNSDHYMGDVARVHAQILERNR
jgi:lipoprotein NlpI